MNGMELCTAISPKQNQGLKGACNKMRLLGTKLVSIAHTFLFLILFNELSTKSGITKNYENL